MIITTIKLFIKKYAMKAVSFFRMMASRNVHKPLPKRKRLIIRVFAKKENVSSASFKEIIKVRRMRQRIRTEILGDKFYTARILANFRANFDFKAFCIGFVGVFMSYDIAFSSPDSSEWVSFRLNAFKYFDDNLPRELIFVPQGLQDNPLSILLSEMRQHLEVFEYEELQLYIHYDAVLKTYFIGTIENRIA